MKVQSVLASLTAALLTTTAANAAIVFSDDFSDLDGTAIDTKPADIGGPWSEVGGSVVNSGVVDTQGAARTGFAGFTSALGAGEILTMTFDAAPTGGTMFSAGFAGVSLYAGGAERIFVGDAGGGTTWAAEESGVGTFYTANSDEDNTATFAYIFDTGVWTLTLSSGDAIGGTIASGIAADQIRFANNNGGDLAIDSLIVDISLVPEPGSLALLGLGGMLIARRRRA